MDRNNELLNIKDLISKTSDLSEFKFLGEKLLDIEKEVNISLFNKVIAQIHSLIDPDEEREEELSDASNVGECSEELKSTSDFENIGCGYDLPDKFLSMDPQKHSDYDERSDEESGEQCLSDESLADPILQALNTFLNSLRDLTSDESVLNDANTESLADSFMQAYNIFLESLKHLTWDERGHNQIEDIQGQMKASLPNKYEFKSEIDSLLLLLNPKSQDIDPDDDINTSKTETQVFTHYVAAIFLLLSLAFLFFISQL